MLLLFLACPSVAGLKDESPERQILARAVRALRDADPEWEYSFSFCTCTLEIEELVGVAIGTWRRRPVVAPSSEAVTVSVYTLATTEAAARWIDAQRRGTKVAKGWTITPYRLGDGANMDRYIQKDYVQYTLTVRKGRFIAAITAKSKDLAETFARLLLREMSN